MNYRQPRYYNEFKCIGAECKDNCCYGWNINWGKEEIDKVKNAPNCSAELKEIMENSFVPLAEDGVEMFAVEFDERGTCPCQTEEGLCRIQKELGAEYLSKTCTLYPRYATFYERAKKVIYRGCNLSCKEIVKKLIDDEKAAELVTIQAKNVPSAIQWKHPNVSNDVAAHPELKYRGEIFEFYYDLIGNKKCSVETSITLGALTAYTLSDLIGNKEYDRIPEALSSFRKQVHDAAGLRAIESMAPNYDFKFGVMDKINDIIQHLSCIDMLKTEEGFFVIERYLEGEKKLNEMMKDKPFWLRNIALNMLLELCVPFHSPEHSVFENYRFFVASFAYLKLAAIIMAYAPEETILHIGKLTFRLEGIDKIYSVLGIISRRLFQSKIAFDLANNILNEFKASSPVHLQLLIN